MLFTLFVLLCFRFVICVLFCSMLLYLFVCFYLNCVFSMFLLFVFNKKARQAYFTKFFASDELTPAQKSAPVWTLLTSSPDSTDSDIGLRKL